MRDETPITVLLSPGFPASGRAAVEAVSPRLRLVTMADFSPPPEAASAEILAWWGGARQDLAALAGAMPQLRWLQSPVAGIGDHRLHEVLGPEVTITSAAGVYADLVAEHVLTLLLALYRRLPDLLQQQRHSQWQDLKTYTLAGDTLGIIGAGGIGRASARLAHAFGMRTIGIHRGTEAVPELDRTLLPEALPELLADSDAVVLAAPLTPRTRGLIDGANLRRMRPTAVLINVGRGQLVVTDDLVMALQEGWIAGAGLDVTDPEPLPPEHPLWQAPGAIITPHHANPTHLSTDGPVRRFSENLRRYVSGESLIAVVNPEHGY